MQNALEVYLSAVLALIEEGSIPEAIDELKKLNEQSQAGMGQDILMQASNYNRASKGFQQKLIKADDYDQAVAHVSYSLSEIVRIFPKQVQLRAKIRGLNTYQFEVPDTESLEKIIGPANTMMRINWLEKALQASKAVCRVVCADGNLGTGFITQDGYLFTNNHVIPSSDVARDARVEFNYEVDAKGNARSRTVYELDPTDFKTSPHTELDFTRVRLVDRPDAPLKQWGYVEFETIAPTLGEGVTIIQHPLGQDKQIALNANEVISIWNPYLFYTTDTERGSSGSPVFNKDWKVVALHHAGRTDQEGGMQINARGDRKGANRGILFKNIFDFLGGKPASSVSGMPNVPAPPVARESFQADPQPPVLPSNPIASNPTPNPVMPEKPAPPPVSAVPKFAVLYDIADSTQADLLAKHLNILKVTKRLRLHFVHRDTQPGEDPMVRAQQELADSDYILALSTVNLFNSDWFGLLYESLEKGSRIIPVRVQKVDLEGTGLEKLRSLPTLDRVVTDFPSLDNAYADVVNELKKLLVKK